MPAKNSQKQYLEGAYYHLYNRGVEKRLIFLDQQDYAVFLSYLKNYLLPKDETELKRKIANPKISYKEKDRTLKLLRLNNFADEIGLLAYALMPNHFHFLIKQNSAGSIDLFMNSLGTRYSLYFNRKYKRVGSLYQGVYKAVLVTNDAQLLELSRYIHRQTPPTLASQGEALQNTTSSYPEYLGLRQTPWVKQEEILSFFSKNNPLLSYPVFVNASESGNPNLISKLIIEDI